MNANNSLNDPISAQTVDQIIEQFSERLGADFEAVANHDSRSVQVTRLPAEHQAELTELLAAQGYASSL